MNRCQKILPVAFVLLLSLTGFVATASAKVKVKIKNCTSSRIRVCVYNGKDGSAIASTGLKMRYVNANGTLTVKCDGQGAGKCNFRVGYVKGTSQCSSTFMSGASAKCNQWLSVLEGKKKGDPRTRTKRGSTTKCE